MPMTTRTIAISKMENPLSPRGVAFLLELGAILKASVGAVGFETHDAPVALRSI
jgi:hypothetical protein